MHIQYLFILLVLSTTYAKDRKIKSNLNPGCPDCPENNVTLVYIKADGSKDTIHQIWDFTKGFPTIIFAIGSVNSTIDIVWDKMAPRHFKFSEQPKYSFSLIIDKIYEYDDIHNMGRINSNSPQKGYTLRHQSWELTNKILSDKEAMVQLQSSSFITDEGWKRGDIGVKLDLLPYKDYAVDLPHLIHTANSTLVDLSLANLTTSREYNASRFAWHAIFASTDAVTDEMHCAMRKSLDDEHTPGVFEIIEIKTPSSYEHGDGGFIQLRPVGYTKPVRELTTSTGGEVSKFNRSSLPMSSTTEAFYHDFEKSNLLVQSFFISFGESGDGFYKQHNYSSWSMTIGYGNPPIEGFSFFVIMVISIGLGVPVTLALSGVVIVVVRRWRQRNTHRRLEE